MSGKSNSAQTIKIEDAPATVQTQRCVGAVGVSKYLYKQLYIRSV